MQGLWGNVIVFLRHCFLLQTLVPSVPLPSARGSAAAALAAGFAQLSTTKGCRIATRRCRLGIDKVEEQECA